MTKPRYKPITTARSPPGTRSTYQNVESISKFTEEQPATHRGNQAIHPTSSIAEFSTAPSAQSTSKPRKHLAPKSSSTSLGPTPHERHNAIPDVFQPPPLPVINISDDSNHGMYGTLFLIEASNCDTQTEIPRRKGNRPNKTRNPGNL